MAVRLGKSRNSGGSSWFRVDLVGTGLTIARASRRLHLTA